MLHHDQLYVIETKIYIDDTYYKNGKYQLANYLDAEQLDEGYTWSLAIGMGLMIELILMNSLKESASSR